MSHVRVAIIGAGSGYMPGIIRGFIHRSSDLAGSELICYDPNADHLALMTRLAQRMFSVADAQLTVQAETDLKKALTDVDFVFTTFRPGGLAARHLDEVIPLRHGVIGQETAGPGGFLMACRSIPVLLTIAEHISTVAPQAWIINYTNPTNIVTGAVTRFSDARIIGLCDQHAGDEQLWSGLLGRPPEQLELDWIGLNHATVAKRVRERGVDITAEVRGQLSELKPGSQSPHWVAQLIEIAAVFGFLPNSYLRYYFFGDEITTELRGKNTTRAQDIMAKLPEYYDSLVREADRDEPNPSRERGGGEHGEFAVDTICAVAANEGRRLIVNTQNTDAISTLDERAIVETPCVIGQAGPVPLVQGAIPHPLRGLLSAISEYEWLSAEAAATGSRSLALHALMVHPFVRSKNVAERILDEGLAAHRDHLPQFSM